jgi:hypothetical protein
MEMPRSDRISRFRLVGGEVLIRQQLERVFLSGRNIAPAAEKRQRGVQEELLKNNFVNVLNSPRQTLKLQYPQVHAERACL